MNWNACCQPGLSSSSSVVLNQIKSPTEVGRSLSQETDTTPTANLETPVNLTSMSLDCNRKLEHPEETQAGTCKLQTEISQPSRRTINLQKQWPHMNHKPHSPWWKFSVAGNYYFLAVSPSKHSAALLWYRIITKIQLVGNQLSQVSNSKERHHRPDSSAQTDSVWLQRVNS